MSQFGHLDSILRSLAAAALLAPWGAHATLVGVTQSFPDITFTASPYLIYDHNAINSTTGLLRVVAGSSALNEGAAAGNSTQSQSYFGAGDTVPDVMLSFRINNSTGALVGGEVSISMGNAATSPRFSWTGTVNSFGSVASSGTIFDATWSVTSDQYQNMPGAMSQFVNNYLTGGSGAMKLTSSAAWGDGSANFANDWVYGSNPSNNANLDNFRAGMTSPLQTNSTITADVWAAPAAVPLPGGLWLLGSGVLALWRTARRRPRETKQFISC